MLYQIVARMPSSFGTPGFIERFWPITDDLMEALRVYREVVASRPKAVDVKVICAQSPNAPDLEIQVHNFINGRYYSYIDTSEELLRNSIEFAPMNDKSDDRWNPPKALWRLFLHKDELRPLIRLMGRVLHGELGGANDGLAQYGPTNPFFDPEPEPEPEPESGLPSEESAGNEEP